jgi:hypothetical protein
MFSVYIIVLVCYKASLYFADSDFPFFGLAFYRTNQLVLCVFQLLIHCWAKKHYPKPIFHIIMVHCGI